MQDARVVFTGIRQRRGRVVGPAVACTDKTLRLQVRPCGHEVSSHDGRRGLVAPIVGH
jgi:hypothetical protein